MMILLELLKIDIKMLLNICGNILEKKGEIYLSKYSGWYSVSDEAFYNDDEIEEINNVKKKSKTSGSTVEWVEEESYFLNYQIGKINF